MTYTPIQQIDLGARLKEYREVIPDTPLIMWNVNEVCLDGYFKIEHLREIIRIHDEVMK